MHQRFTTLAASLSLTLAVSALAQTSPYSYHAGTPYNSVITMDNTSQCLTTLYDPEVFSISADGALDKTLVLYAQGQSSVAPSNGIDSVWNSTRDSFSGSWTAPSGSAPSIMNAESKCFYGVPTPHPGGPAASPDVVKVNGVFYMAWVAGNADLERGRVYWKKSTNGTTWTDLGPSTSPMPIAMPVDSQHPNFCSQHGIGQVQLVYEAPYFYFFFIYYHFMPAPYDGPYTTMLYRIKYDPNDSFGLSQLASDRQMWMGSAIGWRQHDSQIVFDYDDPINGIPEGMRAHRFSEIAGDVTYDPRIGRWIHVFANGTRLQFQNTVTSSIDSDWTDPKNITTSLLDADTRFVANQPKLSPGLWYGSVDHFTAATMYLYIPLWKNGCGNTFQGRSIASAELVLDGIGQ